MLDDGRAEHDVEFAVSNRNSPRCVYEPGLEAVNPSSLRQGIRVTVGDLDIPQIGEITCEVPAAASAEVEY